MKGGERKSNIFIQDIDQGDWTNPTFHKKSVQQKCLSYRLFSSRDTLLGFEEKTLLCFWSAKTAFPAVIGAGKVSHETWRLSQCPNRKKIGTWQAMGIPSCSYKHHPCTAKMFRMRVAHCIACLCFNQLGVATIAVFCALHVAAYVLSTVFA